MVAISGGVAVTPLPSFRDCVPSPVRAGDLDPVRNDAEMDGFDG